MPPMYRILSLLAALILASHALLAQSGITSRRTVAPGVVHTEYTLPGPFTLDVLEVSLRDSLISLESYRPDGLVRTTLQAAANDWEGHRVIGAVNADFFSFETGWPIGNQVVNGKFVQGVNSTRSHLAVDTAGHPFIDRLSFRGSVRAKNAVAQNISAVNTNRGAGSLIFYTTYHGPYTGTDGTGWECALEFLNGAPRADDTLYARVSATGIGNLLIPANGGVLSGASGTPATFLAGNFSTGDTVAIVLGFNRSLNSLSQVIAGSGRILMHGRNVVDSMESVEGIGTSFTDARHPRTFAGFNSDTTVMYICTVDGRQASSIGMTFDDMANFLLSIGATDAFNFDGGGSTTMVVRGTVVNSPSDPAGERSVANTLQVVSVAPTGTLHHLDVDTHRAELFQGQTLQLHASGTDQYYNPIPLPPDVAWHAGSAIGTITSSGLFTANTTNDSGWVTLRWNDVADSAFIVVRTVSRLYVSPPSLVFVPGEQVTMLVRAMDTEGRPMSIANTNIAFSATSSAIDITTSGQVTATDFGEGTLTVTLDSIHAAVPYRVSEADTIVTVEGFEDVFLWSFAPSNADTSQIHVSQTSDISVVAPPALKVAYDLPVGPSSETLSCIMPLAGRPDSIALQVYGTGNADSLVLSFFDKNGDPFVVSGMTKVSWLDTWKDVGFRFNRAKALNGGALDFPVTLSKVQVFFGSAAAVGGRIQGALLLDQMRAHYPSRVVTPLVLEDFEGDISGWQAPTSNNAAQMKGINNSLSTFSRINDKAYTGAYSGKWVFTDNAADSTGWDVRITRRQNYDLGSMLRGSYIGAWVYAEGPTQTELQTVVRGGNGQICAGPRFPVKHVGWKLIGTKLDESLFTPYLTSGIITDENNKFNGFRLRGANADLNGQSRTVIIDRLVTSALSVPTGFTGFSATWNNPLARLHWTVNSEISISRYVVERGSGGAFAEIGFLQAAGNFDTTLHYEYVDTPPAGAYQYRIRQITNDGAQEFSPILEINTTTGVGMEEGIIRDYQLMQNFPNPFNPSTTFRYALPVRSNVHLTIVNVLGQIVAEVQNGIQDAGFQSFTWHANVASGVYFYRLLATSADNSARAFSDVKKMVLLR